ncbi:outer membrane efflux protein [Bacteriovorax sp. BAL6_X]|uniref:TolC family protein n=1 Tax=Bacteriovorax sp. BAL6_X TaxID=1201290 RepID=UPI0003859A9C|nr:TolC family protein [Bacteriovorax sp. BAL6_X]EPZ51171.1 outer membrane efflux protein [Bacteriovorax sp. BAL6_X]
MKKIILVILGMHFSFMALGSGEVREHKRNRHIHGAHKECSLPKSTQDIINCALSFHPSVKRQEGKVSSAALLEDKAGQYPNPKISARYVQGDNNGEKTSELETNLTFTIQLGGKNSAKTGTAKAYHLQAQASAEAIKSQIKMNTILNLYRLRQVVDEKRVLAETLMAFEKVIGQLKKLPRLAAEQEASLTLFEIAFEEAKVNESELFEEERKLEHFFHIATGHSFKEIYPYLPRAVKSWPKVSDEGTGKDSPELKKLKSLSQLATVKLNDQKAQAWPDLQIGPSFSVDKDGSEEVKKLGVNLQIPIPLFQVNGGGKAHARSELLRSQRNIKLTRAEENHERYEQLQVYESSTRILSKTLKQDVIEKKHKRIERLYQRGVVSSSTFLDSLKQKDSYLKSRNHRELTAVKALWNIYMYDGKIFEVSL